MQLKYKLLEAEVNWRDQQFQSIVKERSRIAMDIHDGIGSRLFGARMQLEGLTRVHLNETHLFEGVGNELRDISKELKDIIWSLSKDDKLTQTTLKDIADQVQKSMSLARRTLKIDVEVKTELASLFLMDLQLMIFEMTNNLIKHSSVQEASLTILEHEESLVLKWMELNKASQLNSLKSNGMGLESIQFRYMKWGGVRAESSYRYNYFIQFGIRKVSK
jgi:two-component system NarL family sensor kinase